jgi:hypothetical protein
MEHDLELEELLERERRIPRVLEDLPHRREVDVVAPLGREGHTGSLHHQAGLIDLGHGDVAGVEPQAERLSDGLCEDIGLGRDHEVAAAGSSLGLQYALGAQDLDRLAQGCSADAEVGCHVGFWRQPIAGPKRPRGQGLAELASDLIRGRTWLDGSWLELAPAAVPALIVPICHHFSSPFAPILTQSPHH